MTVLHEVGKLNVDIWNVFLSFYIINECFQSAIVKSQSDHITAHCELSTSVLYMSVSFTFGIKNNNKFFNFSLTYICIHQLLLTTKRLLLYLIYKPLLFYESQCVLLGLNQSELENGHYGKGHKGQRVRVSQMNDSSSNNHLQMNKRAKHLVIKQLW